ncbi:integrase [Paenibacillus phyllosphaerae]|uniref:Integrase n=1 Tax=Paenibacillus phyllosphaerae TaxID=274593 RepID=A0A7W5B3B5_9BACL|nr:tyrosine-type recombinase/integrase [Paenibacillus phyllosphaerae]MBB3113462.1 integrase [Paenibacillus phyllosphaerae]
MKVQEQIDFDTLQVKIQLLPEFVFQFVHFKLGENLSPSSLLEYSRDFNHFFTWMQSELLSSSVNNIVEIQTCHLEQLTIEQIREYEGYLRIVENRMDRSILRKIHSIRSLFNFLHDIAENVNCEPLLRKNVFRKISWSRISNPMTSAREIQTRVLVSEEAEDFITYIRTEFRNKNADNLQAIWNYERNGLRDICIITLMLKSGLLVSDIVNLNIGDLSLPDKYIDITRQWAGQRSNHTVVFSDSTREDLVKYLKVRELVYDPNNAERALFLAVPNGQKIGKRMSKRAVQEMVKKYAVKYGKPELTTRQLRHTFGLEHQKKSSLVKTKEQLALRSIETTEKYHILSELLD